MEKINKYTRYLCKDTGKIAILNDILDDLAIIVETHGNIEEYFGYVSNSLVQFLDGSTQEYLSSLDYSDICNDQIRINTIQIFKNIDPTFDIDKINIDLGYVHLVIAQIHLKSNPRCFTPPNQIIREKTRPRVSGNHLHRCDICNIVINGADKYEEHLKSVYHMKI